MGLTEGHWFEDEEAELTERQLEDAVEEQKAAYERGYHKGYLDGAKAQEPRLVTKEDFKDADEWGYLPVWCETVEGRVYCECIAVTALDIEQSLYRYWTAKPTDDQRKAVKWNG